MATRSTPPNSNNMPTGISLGTPVHTHSSTTGFLNTKYLMRDEIYNAMSHEMSPFFLGPMPPQLFLSTFLLSSKVPPSFKFKVGMFDALASLRTEALMYKVFSFFGTEKNPSDRHCSTIPQDALYSRHITFTRQGYHQPFMTKGTKKSSAVSDIWIEFKSKAEEDAFLVNFPDGGQSVSSSNRLMNQGPKGVSTAGQITVTFQDIPPQPCTLTQCPMRWQTLDPVRWHYCQQRDPVPMALALLPANRDSLPPSPLTVTPESNLEELVFLANLGDLRLILIRISAQSLADQAIGCNQLQPVGVLGPLLLASETGQSLNPDSQDPASVGFTTEPPASVSFTTDSVSPRTSDPVTLHRVYFL
ncbi:hypothetical protein EDB85DRAFT_1887196 [Lactarius pseudohatsudake]|nr:hypothetical protein EDB85DRAFT_1887196 [Lactarius pseudohatsudake]